MTDPEDPLAAVLDYHERTRHLLGRFARSRGELDWENQPDPFRRYPTAPRVLLDEVPVIEGPLVEGPLVEDPLVEGPLIEGPLIEGPLVEGPLVEGPLIEGPRLDACKDADREAGLDPGLDAAWDPSLTAPRALDRVAISQLLYDALALSAWKQVGSARWSLRANPSSGNLHPTEGYLLGPPIPGVADGAFVAHYSPLSHGLELLRALTPGEHGALMAGLPAGTLLVGLASIHWRESWKYGERAYRYCQLDVGHALCALAAAASLLGLRLGLMPQISDVDLASLLGIDAQRGPEAEQPDALLALYPHDSPGAQEAIAAWHSPEALARALAARPHGHAPAPLSREHHPWPVIDAVAAAARKGSETSGARGDPRKPRPRTGPDGAGDPPDRALPDGAGDPPDRALPDGAGYPPDHALPDGAGDPPDRALPGRAADPPARKLIRGRRSAQDMDGETTLGADAFFRLLAALLPATGHQPRSCLPWRPAVHPILFVHRVQGLDPGLYALPREAGDLQALKESLLPGFAWERPRAAPASLPLFLLEAGDVQGLARGLMCQQDIASDGVFAVAFLASFEPRLAAEGPWFYRALHFEAGALGQVLYLEAEALGLSGTGIGCYFDAELHRVLGCWGRAWQCLYCFTVGRAVEDPRLVTLPAYFRRDP